MKDGDYLIWSFEHDSWWRPDGSGYTRDPDKAGHYSRTDAEQIVQEGNVISLNETFIPAHALVRRGL